jgi:hypothetical protein
MLIMLSDLPNSRTLAVLPNRLYLLALELSGRGDRNGPVRPYSLSEVHTLFGDYKDVHVETKGHAILPKRLAGLPGPGATGTSPLFLTRCIVWAERRMRPDMLDQLDANVRVSATR